MSVVLVLYVIGALAYAPQKAERQHAETRSLVIATADTAPDQDRATVLSDDPADSLYRAARAAMADGDYRRAAGLFRQIGTTYPKSTYAPTALYYEAFALYRSGEVGDLHDALGALQRLTATGAPPGTQADAATLKTRICSALAQSGDESCAAHIVRQADSAVGSCPASGDDNDIRIAALNALLQMDSERALPILRKVLARRDACSVTLRRKAVFLVSQMQPPASTDLLLVTAHQDPDPEVREQAVFWLSQSHDSRVSGMLDSIVTHEGDRGVREKALFALSQQDDPRSLAALRRFAEQESAPEDLREKAIFWIGQEHGDSSQAYLKQLFARTTNADLKEKILFSISQQRGESDWLLGVAADDRQPDNVREKALFWAGQSGVPIPRLLELLNRLHDSHLREQIVFALSQRKEPAAVDALMHIAKSDPDPETRKKAVFWLGQSSDPRAGQFLQELVNQ
jgi:HEAT repeat protein